MTDPTRDTAPFRQLLRRPALGLARVGAVVLAVAVTACLIRDAQRQANPAPEPLPAVDPAAPAAGGPVATPAGPVYLQTSKSLRLPPPAAADGNATPPTFFPSSKSAAPRGTGPTLLHSSKRLAPVRPPQEKPTLEKSTLEKSTDAKSTDGKDSGNPVQSFLFSSKSMVPPKAGSQAKR